MIRFHALHDLRRYTIPSLYVTRTNPHSRLPAEFEPCTEPLCTSGMSTKRPPSHLDPAQRDVVWSALCAIVNEQLTVGRAVKVPGLGCFCFDVREEFKGTGGWKTTRTPVLVLSQQFLLNHGLTRESAKDEVGARVGGAQPIFWEGVAARSGVFWESRYTGRSTVSKDIARECVSMTLRIFGTKAGLSDSAILPMGGLGSLRSVKHRLRFHFSAKDSLFGRRDNRGASLPHPPHVFEAEPPVEADVLVLDVEDEPFGASTAVDLRASIRSSIRNEAQLAAADLRASIRSSQEIESAPSPRAPSPRLDVLRSSRQTSHSELRQETGQRSPLQRACSEISWREPSPRQERRGPALREEAAQPGLRAESVASLEDSTPSLSTATEAVSPFMAEAVQRPETVPEIVPLASLQDAAPQQLEQLTSRQHDLAQQRKQERFRQGRLHGRQEGGTISATISARQEGSRGPAGCSSSSRAGSISAREREPAPPHRGLREAITHRPAPELKIISHRPAPELQLRDANLRHLSLRDAISAQNRLVLTPPEPPPAPPPPPPPASAAELAAKTLQNDEWALQKGGVPQRAGSAQRAERKAVDAHNALLAEQRRSAGRVPRAEPMGQLIGSEAGVAAEQARQRAKRVALRDEAREDGERRATAAVIEKGEARAAEADAALAAEEAAVEAERAALERKRAALLVHKAGVEETLRQQAERKRRAYDNGEEAARRLEQGAVRAEAEEAALAQAQRERERRIAAEQVEASKAKEEKVLRARSAVLNEGRRIMLADVADKQEDAARAAAARHKLKMAEQKIVAEQKQSRRPLQQAREAPRFKVHASSPCQPPRPALAHPMAHPLAS